MSIVAAPAQTAPSGAEVALEKALRDARRARDLRNVVVWVGRLALLVAILAVWQFGSGRLFNARFFSSPTGIAAAWWRLLQTGVLPENLRATLEEFAIGYLAGAAVGVVLACVVTLRSAVYEVIEPYVLLVYSMPKVALAPLIILWFGVDLLPKVVLVGLLTFFMVFMSTVVGVRSVPRGTLDSLRVLGAGPAAVYRLLVLPSALPFIVTSLRICVPAAMVGAILGEFISSSVGIGYLIYQAGQNLDTAQMFGLIATLAVVVLLIRALVIPLERAVRRVQRTSGGRDDG